MNRKFNLLMDWDFGRNKRQTVVTLGLDLEESRNNNGVVTTVTSTFVGYGATIRSQQDKDNPSVGVKLALAEALEQLARDIKKDAWSHIHKKSPKPLSEKELWELHGEITDALHRCIDYRNASEEYTHAMANTPEAIAKREEREQRRREEVEMMDSIV